MQKRRDQVLDWSEIRCRFPPKSPAAFVRNQVPVCSDFCNPRSNRRVAERIRRAIAALEPDLMCPVSVREAHPVVLCQLETAACGRIGHDLRAWHSVWIELVVPRRVERVGPIDPLPVTANLNHL